MDQAAYIYDELGRLQRASFQDISIAYNYDDMGNRTSVVAANIPTGVQVITADTTLTAGSPPITIAKLVRNSDLTVTLPDASTALGQEFIIKRDSTGGRTWKWTNTGIADINTDTTQKGCVSPLTANYFVAKDGSGGSVATLYKFNCFTWAQEGSLQTNYTQTTKDMLVSPDGTKLFVGATGFINVYTTTDLTLIQHISLTSVTIQYQMAFNDDGSKLYCATNQGIKMIDTSSYAVSTFASITNGVGVCTSSSYLFVGMNGPAAINVYDINTAAFVTSISANAGASTLCYYLSYDPVGQRVWGVVFGQPYATTLLLVVDAVGLSVAFNKQYSWMYDFRVILDTNNNLAYVGQWENLLVLDSTLPSGEPLLLASLKSPRMKHRDGQTILHALAVLPNNHLLASERIDGGGIPSGFNYYDIDPNQTNGDNIVSIAGQGGQQINGKAYFSLVSPTDQATLIAFQDPTDSSFSWAVQSKINSIRQDKNVAELAKFQQQDFANELLVVKLSDGTLAGWGDNSGGALCNGQTAGVSPPAPVLYDPWSPPDPNASIVDWALTSTNLFVVFSNGSVYAGGQNAAKQLGDNTTTASIYLKQVPGLPGNVNRVWASSGAAGNSGMVFYGTSDNKLYACGLNSNGQLGIGSTTNPTAPTLSWNLGVFSDVIIGQANGVYWTFLITSAGLRCTGFNLQGQLGLGNTTQQTSWQTPTISGVGTVVKVRTTGGNATTRYANTMVLDSNGVVYTTGSNLHGQLSSGNTTARTTFASISLDSQTTFSPLFLDCGYGNGQFPTCWALTDVGTLWSWGYGTDYALFNPNISGDLLTAAVARIMPQVLKVTAPVMNTNVNSPQTIAICADGAIKYAGNSNGIFGVTDQSSYSAFNIPTIPQMPFPQNEISEIFMHGIGTTQRLFVLTKKGKLFALGNNTNAIATGGLAYSTTNTTGMWYQIDFGRYQR